MCKKKEIAKETTQLRKESKPNQLNIQIDNYFIYTMSYIYALKAIMQEDRYFTVSSF